MDANSANRSARRVFIAGLVMPFLLPAFALGQRSGGTGGRSKTKKTAKTGAAVPSTGPGNAIPAIDAILLRYLELNRATAGTFATIRDGRIGYARGYGWCDQEKTRPTLPGTPMRVASISKLMTGAAVKRLMAAGLLSKDTRVLPLLGVQLSPDIPADRRWDQITVGHLLEHKGGWDRNEAGFDPVDEHEKDRMLRELHLAEPSGPTDTLRWMLGKPLQFTPGSRSAYSNFGYAVLGRVIEQVTRRPYLTVVRQEVFRPVGIDPKSVWLAAYPEEQDPREPWYNERIRYLNPLGYPAGGLVLSSGTLCQFLQAYWVSGEVRKPGEKGYTFTFFGAMPGTRALAHQRLDGMSYAAAFNGWNRSADFDKIVAELDAAIDQVTGSRSR